MSADGRSAFSRSTRSSRCVVRFQHHVAAVTAIAAAETITSALSRNARRGSYALHVPVHQCQALCTHAGMLRICDRGVRPHVGEHHGAAARRHRMVWRHWSHWLHHASVHHVDGHRHVRGRRFGFGNAVKLLQPIRTVGIAVEHIGCGRRRGRRLFGGGCTQRCGEHAKGHYDNNRSANQCGLHTNQGPIHIKPP